MDTKGNNYPNTTELKQYQYISISVYSINQQHMIH